jgi:hypothetical protein
MKTLAGSRFFSHGRWHNPDGTFESFKISNGRYRCGKCGLVLKLNRDNFHLKRSCKTGFASRCKLCSKPIDHENCKLRTARRQDRKGPRTTRRCYPIIASHCIHDSFCAPTNSHLLLELFNCGRVQIESSGTGGILTTRLTPRSLEALTIAKQLLFALGFQKIKD